MMWMNIYGDDMDFMCNNAQLKSFPYINSVDLFLFSTFGSTPGWLFASILLYTGAALASDIPVTNSAT